MSPCHLPDCFEQKVFTVCNCNIFSCFGAMVVPTASTVVVEILFSSFVV